LLFRGRRGHMVLVPGGGASAESAASADTSSSRPGRQLVAALTERDRSLRWPACEPFQPQIVGAAVTCRKPRQGVRCPRTAGQASCANRTQPAARHDAGLVPHNVPTDLLGWSSVHPGGARQDDAVVPESQMIAPLKPLRPAPTSLRHRRGQSGPACACCDRFQSPACWKSESRYRTATSVLSIPGQAARSRSIPLIFTRTAGFAARFLSVSQDSSIRTTAGSLGAHRRRGLRQTTPANHKGQD